jgi:hypothetical protein
VLESRGVRVGLVVVGAAAFAHRTPGLGVPMLAFAVAAGAAVVVLLLGALTIAAVRALR